MKPVNAEPPCPYVGLQPFREEDREFFFGRDREQRVISANLLSSSLTILYGASGVGKSSALMAGVVPCLRREHKRNPVVVFRDWAGEDFQVSLARACIAAVVWKETVKPPKPDERLPLDEILRTCAEAAHDTVLVLLDQFEEYFLYHPKSSDPESFEAQFARAVNREEVDVGFLIALREDSLSKLDRFRERIPDLLSNRLILKHLDQDGAASAIRCPLEVWNHKYAGDRPPITIEEHLVAELINQIQIGRITVDQHGGSGGSREEEHFVEAPFLQLVITRLWAEEIPAGSRVLRLATLERLGGAEAIVRRHLNGVMERLDGPSQEVCSKLFDHLVTPTGSKIACSRDDLERWADSLAPKVPEVLKILSGNSILRTVVQSADKPNVTSYEIYHDVLAPAVLSWRAGYIGKQQKAELERKANEADARAREKEQNNRRLILWQRGLWVALALSVIVAIYALCQQQRATEGKNRAMTFAAISGSYSIRDQPELSTLLALQALSLASSGELPDALPRAENAIRRALNQPVNWNFRHDEKVGAVAYSPDGRLVATASGKRVQFWDALTKEKTLKPMEHPAVVNEIAFNADGTRLISGDSDGTLRLWDIQTGDEKPSEFPMQHGASLSAMAVGPGNLLATGSLMDGVIILWNLANGARIGELPFREGDRRWVADLAFNSDGSRLAVGEVNRGETEVWDVSSILAAGSAVPVFTLTNRRPGQDGAPDQKQKMLVDAVAYSPDGRQLATGDRDNTVNLWNAETGAHLDTFWGHTGQLRKLAFSPDGSRLATASADGTARVWDTVSGRLLLTLTGHTLEVNDLAFSPDGNWLVTGSRDKEAKMWNVATHADAVFAVAFHPDGKLMATGSGDNTVRVWEVRSRNPVVTLLGHNGPIQRLAFSPDGNYLASASLDRTVRIWNWVARTVAMPPLQYSDKQYGHDKFYDVAYSPDGKWLAAAGANHNAVAWDAAAGSLLFTGPHGDQVSSVAFSSDGNYLASAGWDGQVKLWSIPSGSPVACFYSPDKGKLLDVNFSPDGERLIMATGTSEVLVVDGWLHQVGLPESRTGGQEGCKDAATMPGPDRPVGTRAQFTPGGKRIVTIDSDRKVKIWDAATGEEVTYLAPYGGKINDVAFSRDGAWVATARGDGTFHASPLNSRDLLIWGCSRVTRHLTNDECLEYLGVDECPAHPCPEVSQSVQ